MGVFLKRIKIFNRAPVELSVMFDGQREPIPAGASEMVDIAVWKAQNQNPVMGTGDPYNPGAAGTKYLIVTEEDEAFGQSLTKEEWEAHCKRPCREDEQIWFQEKYGDDPKSKIITRGSRQSVAARNRQDAFGTPRTHNPVEFTNREA